MTLAAYISIATVCITLVIMIIAIWYYRKVVLPMRGIANGMELMRAQEFSSRLTKVGQPEADRIIELFNTMMQQLKSERLRIREQNHFLDLLISVSPMGIIILDTYGRITMSNPAASEFFGIIALTGLKIEDIDSPLGTAISSLRQDETDTLRLGDSKIFRVSRLSFMDNGYAHPFILIEQLTREVMKAEKQVYEKVIRMISHEVNNSVAGITSMLSTVSAILRDKSDEELGEMAEIMDTCGERCMSMSRFISAYADVVKIPDAVCQPTELNRRINDIHDFLESLCTVAGVKLTIINSPKPIIVDMDSLLFEQALINIVKNSIESSSSTENAEITIEVNDTDCSLTITDNGKGISAETQTHLFTPFYSTKPNGHGLGLIFISDVLTKHHCQFNLQTSKTDGLTRFHIIFPLTTSQNASITEQP